MRSHYMYVRYYHVSMRCYFKYVRYYHMHVRYVSHLVRPLIPWSGVILDSHRNQAFKKLTNLLKVKQLTNSKCHSGTPTLAHPVLSPKDGGTAWAPLDPTVRKSTPAAAHPPLHTSTSALIQRLGKGS